MATDQTIWLVKDGWVDDENCTFYADQIEERISELRDCRADCEEEGEEFPADEAEELRLWTVFRADVGRLVGDFNSAVMVPDEVFEKYVRYEAEQEHGVGPDNLGDWVDWAGYAKARQGEFSPVVVDGQRVWVKYCDGGA